MKNIYLKYILSKMTSELEKIILSFPSSNWYWEELYKNPNISLNFLLEKFGKKINWKFLSRSPNLTLDFFSKNINKPWKYDWLSQNPCVTKVFVEKYKDKPWNEKMLERKFNEEKEERLYYVTDIKRISEKLLEEELLKGEKRIDWWYCASQNPHITIDFILKYINTEKSYIVTTGFKNAEKLSKDPWCWQSLSRNPNISPEIIEKYKDIIFEKLDWNGLSLNPNLTLEFVLKYKDKPWSWSWMSFNKFKFNKNLEKVHLNRLRKIREKVTSFKIKKWYKLYLLTKEEKFYKWYCAPGNIGNKVDKKRIEDHFEKPSVETLELKISLEPIVIFDASCGVDRRESGGVKK